MPTKRPASKPAAARNTAKPAKSPATGTATFSTKLLSAGKTATGFVVPPQAVEQLGAGKRPPVHVTINGYSYRSTIAPMGGKFMIGVSAERREESGVKAGDTLNVVLRLDIEPRTVTVPADLAKTLNREPRLQKAFDALSYSHQRKHVEAIEQAKTSQTRERRIAGTLAALKVGKR